MLFEKEGGSFGTSKARPSQASTLLSSFGPWKGIKFQRLCFFILDLIVSYSLVPFCHDFHGVWKTPSPKVVRDVL